MEALKPTSIKKIVIVVLLFPLSMVGVGLQRWVFIAIFIARLMTPPRSQGLLAVTGPVGYGLKWTNVGFVIIIILSITTAKTVWKVLAFQYPNDVFRFVYLGMHM